jgi:hypothetical protein
MRKGIIGVLGTAVVVAAIIGVGYKLTGPKNDVAEARHQTAQTAVFKDAKSSVELKLPSTYQSVPVNQTAALANSKTSTVMQLQRSNPQAFVIVQHDTGLSGPAALLHENTLEYVETTIRQFYPVRYGASYKSESLTRGKVGSHDAIEHVYSFTDKDGKPNKVHLTVIIQSDDDTYNIILQSHAHNFEAVKDDLDVAKNSFKATN